jgi:hypothetical protein
MKQEDNDGIFAYIESKGTAEPFKVHSIEDLMDMMMSMGQPKNHLSEMLMEINFLLNKVGYYDTKRKSNRVNR